MLTLPAASVMLAVTEALPSLNVPRLPETGVARLVFKLHLPPSTTTPPLAVEYVAPPTLTVSSSPSPNVATPVKRGVASSLMILSTVGAIGAWVSTV